MHVLRITRLLLRLALSIDKVRFARATAFMLCGYLTAPLAVFEFGRLIDAATMGHPGSLWLPASLVAVMLVAQTMLSHFAHLDYFELAELEEAALRADLIDLVNRPARIYHLDEPAFADDMSLVRESLVGTTRSLEATLQLTGIVLQAVVTAVILVNVNAWLMLLPLSAVPPVVLARRANAIQERAREETAGLFRLSRHFIQLATSAPAVAELRVFGGERELLARQTTAWREMTTRLWRGHAKGAALRAIGQMVFSIGYGAAILLVISMAMTGRATIGDVILVITLATGVSIQVSSALALLALLQTAGQMMERMESLRSRAEIEPGAEPARRSAPAVAVPAAASSRLLTGITFDHVSFCYPGSGKPVLRDICLDIPAGSVLALVGENGAGKSTFVKLLCGLYVPTAGRILIDGTDLRHIDPAGWRRRVATLFQDFYRFQYTLREGIGLGDVDRLADAEAVAAAVARARAGPVVDVVPGGLAGYLGRAYGDGVELSGGQWQTVGLARCLMRDEPLLLLLDEPAAALDPAAEHALFERYAASARAGSVTVFISHRLSTVQKADAIAVLEHGTLTQHGTHDDLLAAGGLYAELFRLQARAYQ